MRSRSRHVGERTQRFAQGTPKLNQPSNQPMEHETTQIPTNILTRLAAWQQARSQQIGCHEGRGHGLIPHIQRRSRTGESSAHDRAIRLRRTGPFGMYLRLA